MFIFPNKIQQNKGGRMYFTSNKIQQNKGGRMYFTLNTKTKHKCFATNKKQNNKAKHKYFALNKKRNNKIYFALNKQGQGLIEYLILIALMGIATIGIVRTLNQTVKARFANAIYALQGRSQKAKTHSINKRDFQKSDLSDFMNGAASKEKQRSR